MSLLGLTMAAVTLGFNFYLEEPRKAEANVYADVFTHLPEANTLPLLDYLSLALPFLPCRSLCGLFENGETVFNITGVCVASLPGPAQSTLRYLTSEAFALPLLLAEV